MARRRALGRTALLVASVALSGCGGEAPSSVAPTEPETATDSAAASATALPSAASSGMPAGEYRCGQAGAGTGAVPAVLSAYLDAWSERDETARGALLETALADDAGYVDPVMQEPAVGRAAIETQISTDQAGHANHLEMREWTASDIHHGYAQVRWHHCDPAGNEVARGDDFLVLDTDGRIARSTRYVAAEPNEPARPVCELPVGNWTGIPEIARKWAATPASEPAARAALITETWTEDGSYVDPSDAAPVIGHAALDQRVGGMLWEGAFFEPAAWTANDDHHGQMRLRWRLCDGAIPGLVGVDFVDLDERGRIDRVVGFFPWP